MTRAAPAQLTVLRRVGLSAALAFVVLAVRVAAAGAVPGERRLLEAVVGATHDRWAGPARLVDRATDVLPLALVAALLVLALVRRGRPRTGALAALSVGGVLAANPVLKRLVGSPRPTLLAPLEDASPLSFPSGHAAGTAALAVTAVLAARGSRRRRQVVVAAVLLVALTAAAQLVLARHLPSDLLGGWLWATAWTTLVWGGLARRVLRDPRR